MTDNIIERDLVAIGHKEGMSDETISTLIADYTDMLAGLEACLLEAQTITDPTDPTQRALARQCRLEVKKIRCAVETTRKAMKEDSLRRGRAIDGFANRIKSVCQPEEARLLEIEEYLERQEAARKAALKAERSQLIRDIGGDPTLYVLEAMDETQFSHLCETIRADVAARAEAERKAAEERAAAEEAERQERERVRAENDRLRAEAEQREKELAAERAKAEAERQRVEALEREETQRRADAQRAEEEEAERQRQLEAAPDRDKIRMFILQIIDVPVPEMSTNDGLTLLNRVRDIHAYAVEEMRQVLDA